MQCCFWTVVLLNCTVMFIVADTGENQYKKHKIIKRSIQDSSSNQVKRRNKENGTNMYRRKGYSEEYNHNILNKRDKGEKSKVNIGDLLGNDLMELYNLLNISQARIKSSQLKGLHFGSAKIPSSFHNRHKHTKLASILERSLLETQAKLQKLTQLIGESERRSHQRKKKSDELLHGNYDDDGGPSSKDRKPDTGPSNENISHKDDGSYSSSQDGSSNDDGDLSTGKSSNDDTSSGSRGYGGYNSAIDGDKGTEGTQNKLKELNDITGFGGPRIEVKPKPPRYPGFPKHFTVLGIAKPKNPLRVYALRPRFPGYALEVHWPKGLARHSSQNRSFPVHIGAKKQRYSPYAKGKLKYWSESPKPEYTSRVRSFLRHIVAQKLRHNYNATERVELEPKSLILPEHASVARSFPESNVIQVQKSLHDLDASERPEYRSEAPNAVSLLAQNPNSDTFGFEIARSMPKYVLDEGLTGFGSQKQEMFTSGNVPDARKSQKVDLRLDTSTTERQLSSALNGWTCVGKTSGTALPTTY